MNPRRTAKVQRREQCIREQAHALGVQFGLREGRLQATALKVPEAGRDTVYLNEKPEYRYLQVAWPPDPPHTLLTHDGAPRIWPGVQVEEFDYEQWGLNRVSAYGGARQRMVWWNIVPKDNDSKRDAYPHAAKAAHVVDELLMLVETRMLFSMYRTEEKLVEALREVSATLQLWLWNWKRMTPEQIALGVSDKRAFMDYRA